MHIFKNFSMERTSTTSQKGYFYDVFYETDYGRLIILISVYLDNFCLIWRSCFEYEYDRETDDQIRLVSITVGNFFVQKSFQV